MSVTVVVPHGSPLDPTSRERKLAPRGTDAEDAERVEGAGTRAFCRDDSLINGHYLTRGRFLPRTVAPKAGSERRVW